MQSALDVVLAFRQRDAALLIHNGPLTGYAVDPWRCGRFGADWTKDLRDAEGERSRLGLHQAYPSAS